MTPRAAAERLAVISPGEGEVLTGSRWRFLIEAPGRRVEIAIDGDGWRSCRRGGDGSWWFDWPAARPGRHQALVRCDGQRGGAAAQSTRRFRVR